MKVMLDDAEINIMQADIQYALDEIVLTCDPSSDAHLRSLPFSTPFRMQMHTPHTDVIKCECTLKTKKRLINNSVDISIYRFKLIGKEI